MPRRTRPAGLDRAERVVAGLFEHPPISEAELAQRLEGVSAARARYRLLLRLRNGPLSEAEVPLLVHAFTCLGPGEEGDHLVAILRDGADPHRRAAALQILARVDPGSVEAELLALEPVKVAPVIEHWLSDLLGVAQTSVAGGEGIARALEATPSARRRAIFEQLEACRARVGTTAAAAYGEALRRPTLAPLHPAMREASERERAAPSAALEEGLGFLGSCDGQGTFLVVGATENREDGSFNVAQVCVRAGGALCDGFLSPRCSQEELRERLAEITRCTGIEFVPVALGAAASIACAARRRARGELSEDARASIALLERVEGRAEERGGEAPLVDASLETVRGLLSRAPYEHSWFFDRGDLEGSGVALPGPGARLDDWVAVAAPRLARPAVRERLAAMAWHMARWHRLGGEPRSAALCESAAREVERCCAESALLRAMLERSVVPAEGEGRVAEAGHDPVLLRQHLKRVFFASVSAPTGRDLARLDFTEAAFRALEEACLAIPSERRPREDHRVAAAFAIGRAFADFLLTGAQGPIDQVIDPIERALHEICHLDRGECRRAVEQVLPSLGAFIESHCARCPVACLDRVDAELPEAFFAAAHPADGGELTPARARGRGGARS